MLCVVIYLGTLASFKHEMYVFMLLINATSISDAHITIVIVDLHTMKLKDFRCDLPLSDERYLECLHNNVVACDVSITNTNLMEKNFHF